MEELRSGVIMPVYHLAHLLCGLWKHTGGPLQGLCVVCLYLQHQHHAWQMADAHDVCVEWLWGSGRLHDRDDIESGLEK